MPSLSDDAADVTTQSESPAQTGEPDATDAGDGESTKHPLLLALDLGGTFVLAVQGALAAIASRLDLLGILVLAAATALGGGIIRDVLIGATPPESLRNWRFCTIAIAGTAVGVVYASAYGIALPPVIEIVEAAGLALVAIAGTEKALELKLPAIVAIFLGGISGVGGGTIRDLLLVRVPVVLHAGFYASAALIGAAIMVLCRTRFPATWSATVGALAVFGLRIAAIVFHWSLPIIGFH